MAATWTRPRWRERCPHSPQRGTGWLEGWRLTFGGEDIGWEGALATVVEEPGERVFVVLYELSEPDERVLDHWDGVNLGYFHKIRVRVETLDGDVVAWLYVLNDYEGGLPSARYLGIVADAAEAAGAPRPTTWPACAAALRVTGVDSTGVDSTAWLNQPSRNDVTDSRSDRASRPCAA